MKNIVWLVSYPKSGNTWFRMFLANYKKNGSEPLTLDEIDSNSIASSADDFEDLIGLNPFELTADEVEFYRPDLYRILSTQLEQKGEIEYKKTHDAYTYNSDGEPLFPAEITLKAIYFVRNPLDVCVSYANHSARDVQKTLNLIINEKAKIGSGKDKQLNQKLLSWPGHVQSWEQQQAIPMLFVRYEDMLQNPMETFGSMIRFLDLDYDEERLQKAIAFSDFKLLSQMEKKDGFKEKLQKSESFFWKGKTGTYREYLTEEYIDKIVVYCGETMKQFDYLDPDGKLKV